MKTTPSFESSVSFPESWDPQESEEGSSNNHGSAWGIVSHSDSERNDGRDSFDTDSSEYIDNGVLILPGIEGSTIIEPSDFSIPFSIPTEIGTLHEENDQLIDSIKASHKRKLFLSLILVLGVSSICLGFLRRERNSWRSSAQELEEKIQLLEREKLELKSSCESPPEWAESLWDDVDQITILDNCWVKAKANIKLGACGDETKENVESLAKKTWETWGSLWNDMSNLDAVVTGVVGHTLQKTLMDLQSGTSPDDQTDNGEEESEKPDMSSFPFALGEAIATASALTEAVSAASESMAFEIKELSDDPLKYLASVVKGASHAAQSERVTMKGLLDAVNAVSSASKTLGEAFAETTSEVVSAVMTGIMDDPLSFFEYDTEVKKD